MRSSEFSKKFWRVTSRASVVFIVAAGLVLVALPFAFGQSQSLNQMPEPDRNAQIESTQASDVPLEIKGPVKVTIQADRKTGFLAPRALGMASSVGDNHLTDQLMSQILQSSGVTTLRYPGGRNSDTFHWSSYASNNDFGHFVALMDQFGTGVFTVNYGSNLDGSGGGTPQEAAAWVAYAMGDPSSQVVIGKDASGHDWQTVSYWAQLRAAQPLPADDGLNLLRIGHPSPVLIKYWEVGNEIYQNGYYGGPGNEKDLHAPYPQDAKDNDKQRRKNQNLSPDAYGKALQEYSKAMKAVDPRIKVGAGLDIPLSGDWSSSDWVQDPITGKYAQAGFSVEAAGRGAAHKDFDSGIDWDKGVLGAGCKDTDFVSLHWYTGDTTEASHWQSLDNAKTLLEPEQGFPKVLSALEDMVKKYCGQNNPQVLVTELGLKSYIKISDPIVPGLFAADAYATLVEDGIANIDWNDMRNGGFLDDANKPGPIYFALQLIRQAAAPGDNLVATTTSNPMLSVHAFSRADGKIAIMLINKDGKNNATVKIAVNGANLAASGVRFDYGKSNPATQYMVPQVAATGLGNSFTVTVPAFTITDLVIPKAP